MTRLVDLSMPVHAGMVTFNRVPALPRTHNGFSDEFVRPAANEFDPPLGDWSRISRKINSKECK
jgi:hypothetical protein